MAAAARVAYCTLLTSDAYLPGAMVLAHSLRDCGTKEQLAVLVTLESLQGSTITELKSVYDQIIPVGRIDNRAPANLYLMDRPDLISTFTKVQLWKQTQYEHLIYIDADIVALRAPDELFHNSHNLGGVPDIGWPDCFNSGVLSLKPNMGDYYALLALANRGISFDGADQGLLNMHFRDWERLSFTYNCTPSGNYQYVPAYRHFQSSISLVHYIGKDKPWTAGRDFKGATGVYEELIGRWWAVYDKHYRSTSQVPGHNSQASKIVQQYVKGEMTGIIPSFTFMEFRADNFQQQEVPANPTEPLLTDKVELAEEMQKIDIDPSAARVQRDYSAEWDPQRQAPPTHSRPEAANFPNQVYNMSSDHSLFRPPQNPSPPKGLQYTIPENHPSDKLPPIFPWEAQQRKATRVFPEDLPSTPSETSSPSSPSTPSTPTNPLAAPGSRVNAWDEIPGINRYIRNLPQNRRSKFHLHLDHQRKTSTGTQTPPTTGSDSPPIMQDRHRRPSLKLTDFPTEVERPSLPVTPAPIRRPSFWGAERDAAGDLPAAEGVPGQNEWNPAERLVELARRQSKALEEGTMLTSSAGKNIPDREMVGGVTKLEGVSEENVKNDASGGGGAGDFDTLPPSDAEASSKAGPAPAVEPGPIFSDPGFEKGIDEPAAGGKSGADDIEIGPEVGL